VAELIKNEVGLDAEMTLGSPGEFSVWVDGRQVAKKGLLFFPADTKVLAAVRQALGR
jgi:hypothetical protein